MNVQTALKYLYKNNKITTQQYKSLKKQIDNDFFSVVRFLNTKLDSKLYNCPCGSCDPELHFFKKEDK